MICRFSSITAGALLTLLATSGIQADDTGLPAVPSPEHNPTTPARIALGERLFNEPRFSLSGTVSCASCHSPSHAFTDSPLPTAEGVFRRITSRNTPTLLNVAYYRNFYRDGRASSLEAQALEPFTNPVQMSLPDHRPVLQIVRNEKVYRDAFYNAFNISAAAITMDHVARAIAAFERSLVAGDSSFDRWYYGGDAEALTTSQKRGFKVFTRDGGCAACHHIGKEYALFTDHRFHNVGIGSNELQRRIPGLAEAFQKETAAGESIGDRVMSDSNSAELGHFVVNNDRDALGAFRTPSLRNVSLTAPYMHDGSLETLRGVVIHYNNGGVKVEGNRINPWLSKQLRPLNLTEQQMEDLVAFLMSLTSSGLQNGKLAGEEE